MKKKISINEGSRTAYFPSSVVEEGFKGEIDVYFQFGAVVMIQPNTTMEEQLRALRRIMEEIKDRQQAETRESESNIIK